MHSRKWQLSYYCLWGSSGCVIGLQHSHHQCVFMRVKYPLLSSSSNEMAMSTKHLICFFGCFYVENTSILAFMAYAFLLKEAGPPLRKPLAMVWIFPGDCHIRLGSNEVRFGYPFDLLSVVWDSHSWATFRAIPFFALTIALDQWNARQPVVPVLHSLSFLLNGLAVFSPVTFCSMVRIEAATSLFTGIGVPSDWLTFYMHIQTRVCMLGALPF